MHRHIFYLILQKLVFVLTLGYWNSCHICAALQPIIINHALWGTVLMICQHAELKLGSGILMTYN